MKWKVILKPLLFAVVAIGLIFTVTLEATLKNDEQGFASQPIKVEIVAKEGGFQLLRGGKPYIVKGAGVENLDLQLLVAHGGRAID